MTASEIWQRIQSFDLPKRIRGELMSLWHSAKRLVEAILKFMASHRHFAHCVLLGAIMCFLLCMVPIAIAHHLGLMALVTCGAIGLMQDLRDSMKAAFGGIAM